MWIEVVLAAPPPNQTDLDFDMQVSVMVPKKRRVRSCRCTISRG